MSEISAHEAMFELGKQADPIREALRRMIAEFGDQHYHTCPADNDSGPCDCFAGYVNIEARKALEAPPAPIDDTKDKFKLHYPKEPRRW